LQVVEDFARETGDLQTLSKVDKLVIAAGINLAK
jgi:rRNA maturation endonuclease Nob1